MCNPSAVPGDLLAADCESGSKASAAHERADCNSWDSASRRSDLVSRGIHAVVELIWCTMRATVHRTHVEGSLSFVLTCDVW